MLSEIQKEKVKLLKNEGYNFSQISTILNITRSAARHCFIYTNTTNPKKRGPRAKFEKKHKLQVKREIGKLKLTGEKVNSTKLVKNCKLNFSTKTVQRYMKNIGMKYKNAKCQILLSKNHKHRRISIINNWISTNHEWEKTIFSDEKRFSLDGPDDWKSYVRDNESLIRQRRQCHGGGIMVWMMILPNGLLCHKIIYGRFSSKEYLELLHNVIVPIATLNFGEDFYFQEDNCSVHKAKVVQHFMQNNNIRVITWPAKSPDINITEDVWKLLSDKIYDGRQYENRGDLIYAINQCINEINFFERHKIINLYSEIRARLCKILYKRGNLYNK